jgi:hypothetical protein
MRVPGGGLGVDRILDAKAYADLFRRAMRSPLDVADSELALLSDKDRALVATRIDVEVGLLENHLRRRVGLPPLPPAHRISSGRLAQLSVAVASGGLSPLDISYDEWVLLCAGGHLDELGAA